MDCTPENWSRYIESCKCVQADSKKMALNGRIKPETLISLPCQLVSVGFTTSNVPPAHGLAAGTVADEEKFALFCLAATMDEPAQGK